MTPDEPRGIPDDAALVEPYPDENICTTCEGREAVIAIWGDVLPLDDCWMDAVEFIADLNQHIEGRPAEWQVDDCPECGRGGEVGKL